MRNYNVNIIVNSLIRNLFCNVLNTAVKMVRRAYNTFFAISMPKFFSTVSTRGFLQLEYSILSLMLHL